MINTLDKDSAISCDKVSVAATSGVRRDGAFFQSKESTAFSATVRDGLTKADEPRFEKAVSCPIPGATPGSRRWESNPREPLYESGPKPLGDVGEVAANLLAEPANDVKDLPAEEWRPCPHFVGYQVSNLGRVRNRRGLVMRTSTSKLDQYPRIAIRVGGKKKSIRIHLEVAAAFLGPCPDSQEVDHKDGNKGNASADNLEYVTHAENMRRAIRNGQFVPVKGERHGSAKLKTQDVLEIVSDLEKRSARYLSRRHHVSVNTIYSIARGNTWSHVTGIAPAPSTAESAR